MNVMLSLSSTPVQLLAHIDEAWVWRGGDVEEFAMAEVTASKTLATLSKLASRRLRLAILDHDAEQLRHTEDVRHRGKRLCVSVNQIG